VIAVQDGDTLTLLVIHRQIKVRLADIDAPERKQAFGTRSRQSLTTICHGKSATVIETSRDRYGRTVGHVTCAGIDAQAHQVSTGMAWVFDRYAPPSSPLYALQDQARNARRGLWADPSPVPPWDWRRQRE
jgi:endonuclease YncB( thermonuclease family)